MKRCCLFIVIISLISFIDRASAQDVAFSFVEENLQKINEVTKIISIDKRQDSLYYAYASEKELNAFLKMGYKPVYDSFYLGGKKASYPMAMTAEDFANFDKYPTYDLYLSLMQSWAEKYPQLCRLDTIGTSVKGRLLLALKISDKVNEEEAEPEFFYTSSIHGDELTGYVLMLRLIDYMLANYEKDTLVTRIINETQLYINPIANPDGAYFLGDNNVSGAKRYNTNSVDLNRNYPDPKSVAEEALQKENQAMISFADKHNFAMSVNFHGGAEVLNFPWDSYASSELKHADYTWWNEIDKKYVDSCRVVDISCFADIEESGYVHGGDWYKVYNGRQDYMNRRGIREQTIELSTAKMLGSEKLVKYWNVNKVSLINYIAGVHYGISGTVTDSITGKALAAKIEIENRDKDSSEVYSYLPHGKYYRPIEKGKYTLIVSAQGYQNKEVKDVEVEALQGLTLNITLLSSNYKPDTTEIIDTTSNAKIRDISLDIRISPNPVKEHFTVFIPQNWTAEYIRSVDGRNLNKALSHSYSGGYRTFDVTDLSSGIYILSLINTHKQTYTVRFVKL